MIGLQTLIQQCATSNLSNVDYEVILLTHNEDIQDNRAKLKDEPAQEGIVDGWLDAKSIVTLEDALSHTRQEYLTSLGSIAQNLSPTQIYETVNEVYKPQLKSLHQIGKGIQITLDSHERNIKTTM